MHHLHDGPIEPFYVSKFNTKTISSKPLATLAALQWAAEREGVSYGVFTLKLTEADQKRIQVEYEAYQREWKKELAAKKRVTTFSAPDLTFILNDEDV